MLILLLRNHSHPDPITFYVWLVYRRENEEPHSIFGILSACYVDFNQCFYADGARHKVCEDIEGGGKC